MKITVNGEERIITGMSVYEYLHSIECDPMPIAVELNRSILKKNEYQTTLLAEGDQLEIVWFVGGG
jgi:sulfur carrier protein